MYSAIRGPQCTQDEEKCYQTAWMKSREPFDGLFAQKVRATGTDQQKMLMGAIEKW